MVLLRDRGNDEQRLSDRKMIPDAQAGSSAKRHVGESRTSRRCVRRKTFRIKALRIRPEAGVVMDEIRADDDIGSGRNVIPPDGVILRRRAHHEPHRGVHPHRFFQHLAQIAESGQIVRHRRAAVENGAQLVVHLPLYLGKLR